MDDIGTVKVAIGELVGLRRSFTGKDVFERIRNRRIRRDVVLACKFSEKEVSMVVRRCFNYGDPVFQEYGSAITYPNTGPILYFPLPSHAKKKAHALAEKFNPVLPVNPVAGGQPWGTWP
jgi:hypothetical protein